MATAVTSKSLIGMKHNVGKFHGSSKIPNIVTAVAGHLGYLTKEVSGGGLVRMSYTF